jgi:hypothetical protein
MRLQAVFHDRATKWSPPRWAHRSSRLQRRRMRAPRARSILDTHQVVWPASIAWHELVGLMAVGDGRDHSMVGVVRTRDVIEVGDDVEGPEVETLAGLGRVRVVERRQRVWKRGHLMRLEKIDGQPRMIVGAETRWVWLDGEPVPTAFPTRTGHFGTGLGPLLERRGHDQWEGEDFTHPTGDPVAAEFLGRQVWQVELAPPAHKPLPLTLIIDARTGLVLSEANEGFTSVDEWVELSLDADLPEELFEWTGEVLQRPSREAEHAREMATRKAWLDDRAISDLPLAAPVELSLHEFAEDGSFHASIEARLQGSLVRRPHASDVWNEPFGWDHIVNWTDEHWDWRLGTDVALDEAILAAVKARLSSTS